MPVKEAEHAPWEQLCVDLIGPYTVTLDDKTQRKLWAITMIDPATGWFEIAEIQTKRADIIANLVEQIWLTRYPRPITCTMDRGGEFIGDEFKNTLLTTTYGIKARVCTTKNPQANAIVERVHQTLANLLRATEINKTLDPSDPWSGILAAAAFAIRSTYHTTLKATPGQLVFGRDMIFNTQFIADWKLIRDNKQRLIAKNNERENKKRIPHVYKHNQLVLLTPTESNKLDAAFEGPYKVTKVHSNGTLSIKIKNSIDTVNIRRVKPYYKQIGKTNS